MRPRARTGNPCAGFFFAFMESALSFWTPLDLDKSVESDSHRTICGIISTEDPDLDNEIILEQGSSYSPMLDSMGKKGLLKRTSRKGYYLQPSAANGVVGEA